VRVAFKYLSRLKHFHVLNASQSSSKVLLKQLANMDSGIAAVNAQMLRRKMIILILIIIVVVVTRMWMMMMTSLRITFCCD